MLAISNAFFLQAEIVQRDRWAAFPLEIAFVQCPRLGPWSEDSSKIQLALHDWNQSYAAGYLRRSDTFEAVTSKVPGIEHRKNPNIILAPRGENGVSELHVMLASLLPDALLAELSIERARANMGLSLFGRHQLPRGYASTVEQAFSQYIWNKMSPGKRSATKFFSPHSPMRLLAGDSRFWMQRIYRIALERRESFFAPTTHEDAGWVSMDDVRSKFYAEIPAEDAHKYYVRRPLTGGTIWDEKDHNEREAVIDDAISGAGVMDSLDPIVDLLRVQRVHEDFSARASWIKEDFERSFYSKRAKLKVELVETIDNAPVWDTAECDGYSEVLFRDLLAVLNLKERKLLLAVRQGKTPCEIASSEELRGHAAISRRIKALKSKLGKLLH
jgi:hypothetical protein